jgi:hypothetical protein
MAEVINFRPTTLCPCGSRSMVAVCCFDERDQKLRKKIPSIEPPGPVTGYAHPSCYLRGTGDCSTKISGEHYFSASILEQISEIQGLNGGVRLAGMPWLKPGETQDLAIKNLTANILCKRHNEALSPLDQEAGRFFTILKRLLTDFSEGKAYRKPIFDLVSGTVLELWMLKVACGMYFSIASREGVKLSSTHSIDLAKIEDAFFRGRWDDHAGLYFSGRTGSVMKSDGPTQFIPLSNDITKQYCGTRIHLLGLEMEVIFDTSAASPGPWTAITRRPSEMTFVSPKRKHYVIISWPSGTSYPGLRFDC